MRSWSELTELFSQTLELPESQREDFLKNLFQEDRESLTQIRNMLAMHVQAASYFEQLQINLANQLLEPSSESPCESGQQLGAFTIQEEIGRGGMAIVYSAHRSDGQFQQEVAIKVIKKGIQTEESLQRFKYERQLLARLNHPNIARLFDGGTTEQGLPYFVMEKVEGNSLDDFLAQNNLKKSDKWVLIDKIVQAVNYAHRNLIVHGDLKPANIRIGQDGTVKLLDFGIATLIEEENAFKDLAFTPDYGSPEHWNKQALLPASDVFQLGLMMVKVFTGSNPQRKFSENNQWNEQAFSRFQQWLKEQALSKEEYAIICKCLFINTLNRYENANALAEDILALVNNKPIKALEPTIAYVLTKYAQRNKVVITAYSLSILALLAISTFYIIDINQKKREAELQKNKAEQFSSFLIELFSAPDPFSNNSTESIKDISLKDFVTLKRRNLSTDTLMDPDFKFKLSTLLSDVYFNINENVEGMKSLNEQEIFTTKHFGKNSNQMASIWYRKAKFYTFQSLYDSSTWAYQKALGIINTVATPDQYLKATILNNLGLNYHYEGRFDEAEMLYLEARQLFASYPPLNNEVLANHNNYAQLLRMTGRFEDALTLSKQVLNWRLEQSNGDSTNLQFIQTLSDHSLIAMELGDYILAKTLTQKVIIEYLKKLGEDHYNTNIARQNFATILILNKEFEEAEKLIKNMLEQVKSREGTQSYDFIYLSHMYTELLLIINKSSLANPYLNDALLASDIIFPSDNTLKSILHLDAALVDWMIGQDDRAQQKWVYASETLSRILPSSHYRIHFLKAIQQTINHDSQTNYLDSLKASKANVDRYVMILENLSRRK